MPINNTQTETPENPSQILAMLIKSNMAMLGPYQKGVEKKLKEMGEAHVEEAINAGVPPEHIQQQAGLEHKELLANLVNKQDKSKKKWNWLYTPFQIDQETSEVTPASLLGGLIQMSPENLLKRVQAQSIVQNQPLEYQQEARRQHAEERLTRQYELNKVSQYGGKITSQDIEENPELNSMIEGYGLRANVDSQTGERTWTIPDRYRQRAMASQQNVTPSEKEFFDNALDAIDTGNEIVQGLGEIGVSDLRNIGKVQSETIMSEMGPFSIPARFYLAGQYAKDPKYTALKSKLERLFQKYRKVITGAQASYAELKLLRPLIASFSQRPDVFFENIKTMNDEGIRMLESRIQTSKDIGRNVGTLEETISKRRAKTSNQLPQGYSPDEWEVVQ